MDELKHKQSIYTDKMYQCIDNNNIEGFIYYFNEWHLVTSILSNYTSEEIQLNDDIKQYAKNNCIEVYNIYYD